PVLVECANHGQRGRTAVTAPSEPITVRLTAAASLSGRLVGDPAPASFTVWSLPGGGPDEPVANEPASEFMEDMARFSQRFTGDHFQLDGLKPGREAISVRTDDGRSGKAMVELGAGEETRIATHLPGK